MSRTPPRAPLKGHAASVACAAPQAPIIKEKYSLCHLATGDLLRAAVAAGLRLPILRLDPTPARPAVPSWSVASLLARWRGLAGSVR